MEAIKIYEPWCKKQQQDFEELMQAVDDLGAASLALATSGALGYTQFIDSRERFKKTFADMSKHYRYVE